MSKPAERAKKAQALLETEYPRAVHEAQQRGRFDLRPVVAEQAVPISAAAIDEVREFIKALYRVSRTSVYQEAVAAELDASDREILGHPARQLSILMAYDFHLDPSDGRPRLIEVNTNAAGFLLAELSYRAHGIPAVPLGNPRQALCEAFKNELRLSGVPGTEEPSGKAVQVALLDENISEQKMYLEFLLYREAFSEMGWETRFVDMAATPETVTEQLRPVHLIYNRFCDFRLREPKSQSLRQIFLRDQACLTPHPREYLLLADKRRMIQWSQWNRENSWLRVGATTEEAARLSKVLLKTHHLQDTYKSAADRESLWAERKTWFFKPSGLYGGKLAYRGASLSRKAFLRLREDEQMIVQEYVPAPSTSQDDWRYDLRFYVYGDQIQLGIARLYQGQVTNLSTPGGGFAPLIVQ